MSESNQQDPNSEPAVAGNQELFHAAQDQYSFPADEFAVQRKPASKRASGLLIILLGLVAVAAVGLFTLTQKQFAAAKTAPDTDDMGAGISQAAGLRGHLVTRWEQGKTQYMLKMEPLDPRDAAGFSAVAANPPAPLSINIRLLDASGFALCGKEILLRFAPPAKSPDAGSQEKTREAGKDVFQNIQGNDGSVEALWAQGTLPCSPDQYKKFDYWDLNTNFPTLAEQDALLGRGPGVKGARDAKLETAALRSRRKAAVKAPVSTFYVEGDDQVSMYEPSRALLSDDSGRSFFIPSKSDQAIAATWAANYSHIHFKCDQHANCALRTGSGEILGRKSN